MSTKKPTTKLVKLLFLLIFLVLIVNFLRQLSISYRLNRRLSSKQKELVALQEKNRVLQLKLKEVENQKFWETQVKKILGWQTAKKSSSSSKSFGEFSQKIQKEIPLTNYQKWWRLFVY